MNKNGYFLATGDVDKKRMQILNQVYNPSTHAFLTENGLKSGMNVLEIGCGYGYTAIWIATHILPGGIVYAVDRSEDTLVIARENAKKAHVHNIEFINLDIVNIASLNKRFDFFYGRWILEFCNPAIDILKNVYNLLNPNGIFTYEACSFLHPGHFSFTNYSAIDKWNDLARINATRNNAELNLSYQIYSHLKNIGYNDIYARNHQAILITPEEKSVYRLALISARDSWIRNNVMTETEIDAFMDEFSQIENDPSIIIGFYNNTLIRGIK